jgi:putative DNA primase/helicase
VNAHDITIALGGKWQGSYGTCRCPAHNDREPSLKIRDDDRKLDGIDLVCFAGCRWQDVKVELAKIGLLDGIADSGLRISAQIAPPKDDDDDGDRLRRAANIWRASVPLDGTLAELYLRQHRKLDISRLGDLSHVLRYQPDLQAMIALMTYPALGEACGVHRTILDGDGRKLERKMLGRAGVIRLSPDEDVTMGLGVAEGVEDGLRILLSGWRPVWACGSAGAIASFPVLPAIESLSIFPDSDDAGLRAAEQCAQRWHDAGAECRVVRL